MTGRSKRYDVAIIGLGNMESFAAVKLGKMQSEPRLLSRENRTG